MNAMHATRKMTLPARYSESPLRIAERMKKTAQTRNSVHPTS
jgi:hypothetical protein